MTHQYEVNGMTCSHCEARVQKAILSHPEVTEVKINREAGEAVITMKHHVSIQDLQEFVGKSGGYTISEKN